MNRRSKLGRIFFLGLLILLTACQPAASAVPSSTTALTAAATASRTPTSMPTFTQTAAFTATPVPTIIVTPTPTAFTGMVPAGARLRLARGAASLFGITPDGQQAVVGSQATLCVYQVSDGAEVWCRTPGEEPNSDLSSLLVSPDGKTIFTESVNGNAILWDAATGAQKLIIRTDQDLYPAATWSPDSQQLAVVLDDGGLVVWNARDGSQAVKISTGDTVPNVIRWSPDGKFIAGGMGYARTVIIWDAATGQVIATYPFFPEMYQISSLAWTADSSQLLAGSSYVSCMENCNATYGGQMVLFDAQTGEQKWLVDTGQWVESLSINPDGSQVLAQVGFDAAQLFQMSNGSHIRTIAVKGVVGVDWLPGDQQLLSLDPSGKLVAWNLAGQPQAAHQFDGYMDVVAMAWSPDSRVLAASEWPGSVTLWDRSTGQPLRTIGSETIGGMLAWSPDGKQIATQSSQQVLVWDAQTSVLLRTLPDSGMYPGDVAWSPDGRWFASMTNSGTLGGSWTRYITIWNTRSWQLARIIQHSEDNSPGGNLAWSPDAKTLAADGNGIFLWDAATGQLLQSFGYDYTNGPLQWSPDGTHLLDNNGDMWDVVIQTLLLQFTGGDPADAVWSAALSPDGKLLVTGGDRLVLRSPVDGTILSILAGSAGRPSRLAFSPDGRALASLSEDGTVILWDVPEGF